MFLLRISVRRNRSRNDFRLWRIRAAPPQLAELVTTVFLATRRVRSLPDPGRPPEAALGEFAGRLARAIEFGRG